MEIILNFNLYNKSSCLLTSPFKIKHGICMQRNRGTCRKSYFPYSTKCQKINPKQHAQNFVIFLQKNANNMTKILKYSRKYVKQNKTNIIRKLV